jgi:hypothetical protein
MILHRRRLAIMARAILRMLPPLLLCGVQTALGCSLQSMELRQVSPDLTIVVTHRGKPIAGIAVQVVPEKSVDPVFTGDTDEHGTVLIEGLMAGRYHLTASRERFDAGREWIEVVAVPDAKTRKRFDFQWADWSYQTRRVEGTLTGLVPGDTGHPLMDIAHPKEAVYPGVDITLKDVFSGAEYRTVSDSTGTFRIGDVPDGIYIMTIAGGMKAISGTAETSRHVIDVLHAAKVRNLPLRLKDTGCYSTEFALTEGD